ncbi:MAG: hydroxymethylglutaryl-CoA lyase [Actinomycetota bacterium]
MSILKPTDELPPSVTVVEVGPRDGLQNEIDIVPLDVKVAFIDDLSATGLSVIETTSFVSPKWVPQLADAAEVLAGITRSPSVRYPVLVPNMQGLERGLEAGVGEVSIFASATESFSRKNLNRSRDEAFEMFRPVCEAARAAGLRLRGYLSMVLHDPWEGQVKPEQVTDAALKLLALGCDEISLGDTTGAGTPAGVEALILSLLDTGIALEHLAVHFHDTYGQALANVLAALQMGVTVVDSSAGGLGGCPFAKSATGNLATEDLVWMLDGLGVKTGVDVYKVAAASNKLCKAIGKVPPGNVARALAQEGP